jgi:hypothetical protein
MKREHKHERHERKSERETTENEKEYFSTLAEEKRGRR